MASGYEKSPDYGGPQPSWSDLIPWAIIVGGLGALMWWRWT